MNYLFSFLLAGTVCAIAQVILDNSKLTPGHITSLFTVLGSFVSFLGFYQTLVAKAGAGATVLISNFGHLLYQGGLDGYKESGFLGIFTGLLSKSSAAIVGAIVFAFIITIFFKPKS